MPGIDGLETTREIIKYMSDNKLEIPIIIALTANVYPAAKEQCYRVGMRDFLSKPIQLQVLRDVLKKYS